jgi:hypothetical protein
VGLVRPVLYRLLAGLVQTLGDHMSEDIAKALRDTLISPNEADSNLEPANVVDGLFKIARAILRLAEAIEVTYSAPEKS